MRRRVDGRARRIVRAIITGVVTLAPLPVGGLIRVRLAVRWEFTPRRARQDPDAFVNQLDAEVERIWQRAVREETAEEIRAGFIQRIGLRRRRIRRFDPNVAPVAVGPNDFVGIQVRIPNSDQRVFHVWARVRNSPMSLLFDLIQRLLQSAEGIMAVGRWEFRFNIIRVPRGQQRKKRKLPWSLEEVKKGHSLVRVVNDDGLCLWRALAICEGYIERNRLVALLPPGTVARRTDADKAYQKLIRRNRGVNRIQRDAALQMQRDTNTSLGDFDDILAISEFKKVNITVLNVRSYDTRFIDFRTVDHLLANHAPFSKTWYIHKDGDHFDAVNSITGFLKCSYYCEPCRVRTKNKGQHRCPGSDRCYWCSRNKADHMVHYVPPRTCDHCFRMFKDQFCYDEHKDGICQKSWEYVF